MKISTPDFLRSRWFLLISLVLVAYSFYILGKMVWQNYEVNKQIRDLETEVEEIESDNQKLADLIAYFQTDTYKKQEAREKLGFVMPGEEVLVFPEQESDSGDIIERAITEEKKEENLPNYQKWWNFLFSD